MFRKLRAFLYRDAAENSLMVVISQQVSLIIMAALAGLMFILITGGVRIQAENAAQTELRIANRAFVNDVDNAARIFVQDNTKLTLSSTKFLKNAAGEYVCRASSWYFAEASEDIRNARANETLMSIYNDVTVYATADCDGTPTSTQTRVAVSGVTQESQFVFTNIAGVNLQFSNGIVTNFVNVEKDPVTQTYDQIDAAQFRTDNNVDEWYTDDEMYRDVPKVIEAQLTAFLPITQENNATFKATTNEAETELVGNNDNITDPGGEQTRWVPNPVSDVFVKRSTTTGTYTGGVREGVQISWTPRPTYECSPTQTLTYSWLITNLRTNHQSSGESTGVAVQVESGTGGAAEIWNGGAYKVQVAARCNDVDGQSGDKSLNYTLPLPNVVNVSVNAIGGNQANHEVTWASASSDPTVKYTVQYAPADVSKTSVATSVEKQMISEEVGASNGAYRVTVWEYPNMPWATVGEPSVTSFTKTGNAIVPGYPDSYHIRASTTDSPNTSGEWSPQNYTYSVAAPARPVITAINQSSFTWDNVTCTANTAQQFQSHSTNEIGSDGNPPSDETTSGLVINNGVGAAAPKTKSYTTINQGSRVYDRVEGRCTTKYTLAPTNGQVVTTLSPWSARVTTPAAAVNPSSTYYANNLGVNYFDYDINPTTRVSGVGTDNPSTEGGTTATTSWNSYTACPTGTTRTGYYHDYTENGPGAVTAISGTSRSVTHNNTQGTRYTFTVFARCQSFATGTSMTGDSPTGTDSYYSTVTAPSVTATRSNTNVQIGTYISISGTATCSNGASRVWEVTVPRSVTRNTQGTSTFTNTAHCQGANGRTSGSSSDSVSAYWYAPAPSAPGGGDGTYIMTCDYVNGGYSGFSGWVEWNSSSNATSYSVTMRYTTDTGSTAAVDLGTSASQRRTYQSGASSNNPGIKITVTANGPGGSTSSVFTPDRVPGGCA